MALAFQSGESVKQALFEELQNLLNADKDIRTNAEGRIKQLEFTEGTWNSDWIHHLFCLNGTEFSYIFFFTCLFISSIDELMYASYRLWRFSGRIHNESVV